MDQYIGLGKTLYDSSVSQIIQEEGDGLPKVEVFLSERFNRKKNSGASPLFLLKDQKRKENFKIAENGNVAEPEFKEEMLDRAFPFYSHLSRNQLTAFSKKFNTEITNPGHHLAHAYAAILRSPFEKALVVVMDGAGSSQRTLRSIGYESDLFSGDSPDDFEHLSVYLFEKGELKPVKKLFMRFFKTSKFKDTFSNSMGIFYEMMSKFIFNNKNESGKVMGLAPFGKAQTVIDYRVFLESLDWEKSFKGKGKQQWESSLNLELYKDLAATAQLAFEQFVLKTMKNLRTEYPTFIHLVFTGGSALNCTTNWKLKNSKLFDEIYIPPNPGDESIGLGCAAFLWFKEHHGKWKPTLWSSQISFLGSRQSIPQNQTISTLFKDFNCEQLQDVAQSAAQYIADGKIVAWFQGVSECGPRSLGHRSILARPDRSDLKTYLNNHIKFREAFRPYGCTVIWEKSHLYFESEKGFNNPFMSYAVPVKAAHKTFLKHVLHVDDTSRFQTLEREQDPLYYALLEEVEKLTGHPIVLNTSLNVMNEPILETSEDALRFMQTSEVDALFIGNYLIRKN